MTGDRREVAERGEGLAAEREGGGVIRRPRNWEEEAISGAVILTSRVGNRFSERTGPFPLL